jgi:hypothetical protein
MKPRHKSVQLPLTFAPSIEVLQVSTAHFRAARDQIRGAGGHVESMAVHGAFYRLTMRRLREYAETIRFA